MEKQKKNGLERVVSTVFLLVLSILCIIFSSGLLFVSNFNEKILCYVCMGAIIGWGITLIARYFGKHSYKKMHDYNFSLGVFLVIVGCCGLVRVNDLVSQFNTVIGIIVLAIGILLLQSAIQLRSMNSALWATNLILAIIMSSCAIIMLMNFEMILNTVPNFPYWVLFIASICNTLNFPLLGIKLFIQNKREEKEQRVQVTQSELPDEVLEAEIKEVKAPKIKHVIKGDDTPIVLSADDLNKEE